MAAGYGLDIVRAFRCGILRLAFTYQCVTCTFAYSAVTIDSIYIATEKMQRPRAAASLVTTAAWLMLANPVGVAQAAWNYDPFWDIGPLAEPPQKWVKHTPGDSGLHHK